MNCLFLNVKYLILVGIWTQTDVVNTNLICSNPTKGTTIDMIWKGLNEFYAHAGWHKLVGRVDHIAPSIKEGSYPYLYDKSSGANSDAGGTFQAIMSEINKNRTILASFSSWNLVAREDSHQCIEYGEFRRKNNLL